MRKTKPEARITTIMIDKQKCKSSLSIESTFSVFSTILSPRRWTKKTADAKSEMFFESNSKTIFLVKMKTTGANKNIVKLISKGEKELI